MKLFLKLILLLLLSPVLRAAPAPEPIPRNQPAEMPHFKIEMVESGTIDQIGETLRRRVPNVDHPEQFYIFSTDVQKLLEEYAPKYTDDQFIVLPFGNLTTEESQSKFQTLVQTYQNASQAALKKSIHYKDLLVQSAKSDRIGLIFVSWNIGAEWYFWAHASNVSTFQMTGNVMFSLITSIVFGVNKDAWSHSLKPIQKFMKAVVGAEGRDFKRGSWQDLSLRFASSFVLASTLNMARIPFLPADALVNANMWVNNFTMPMILSFVATVASLGWSENLALINETTHPVSKFLFRRLHETRSIVYGVLASTAMLLNPSVYGTHPWIILTVTGINGFVVYLNNERIVEWIENNTLLKRMVGRLSGRSGTALGLSCNRVHLN